MQQPIEASDQPRAIADFKDAVQITFASGRQLNPLIEHAHLNALRLQGDINSGRAQQQLARDVYNLIITSSRLSNTPLDSRSATDVEAACTVVLEAISLLHGRIFDTQQASPLQPNVLSATIAQHVTNRLQTPQIDFGTI